MRRRRLALTVGVARPAPLSPPSPLRREAGEEREGEAAATGVERDRGAFELTRLSAARLAGSTGYYAPMKVVTFAATLRRESRLMMSGADLGLSCVV